MSVASLAIQPGSAWDPPTSDQLTRTKLVSTKSFTRLDSSSSPLSTIDTARAQSAASSENSSLPVQNELTSAVEQDGDKDDVFAGKDDIMSPTMKAQESFDELPIEIRSLTERCPDIEDRSTYA